MLGELASACCGRWLLWRLRDRSAPVARQRGPDRSTRIQAEADVLRCRSDTVQARAKALASAPKGAPAAQGRDVHCHFSCFDTPLQIFLRDANGTPNRSQPPWLADFRPPPP